MATIEKRRASDGAITFRVKVRRRGCPTQTETFTRLTDAKNWATKIEGSILDGRHFPEAEARRRTVGEATFPLTRGPGRVSRRCEGSRRLAG
jgi:hypothetical protein